MSSEMVLKEEDDDDKKKSYLWLLEVVTLCMYGNCEHIFQITTTQFFYFIEEHIRFVITTH